MQTKVFEFDINTCKKWSVLYKKRKISRIYVINFKKWLLLNSNKQSYILFIYRVAAMESITNVISNGQTNGVVVSGPVGSGPAGVVTAGTGVGQGNYS